MYEISSEKATKEGFEIRLFDPQKVDSTICSVIKVVMPAEKEKKYFSNVNLILRNSDSHAGRFNLVPASYEDLSKFSVTFETCKNSSNTAIINIIYGEGCSTNTYSISVKP